MLKEVINLYFRNKYLQIFLYIFIYLCIYLFFYSFIHLFIVSFTEFIYSMLRATCCLLGFLHLHSPPALKSVVQYAEIRI